MTDHRAEALRWLAIAEQAYADRDRAGTLAVVGAASIAQAHAALASTPTADYSTAAETTAQEQHVIGFQCTTPVCAGCGCWCHAEQQPTGPIADHPHNDPGDGRTECERCGKWIWPVIHSCKGVPVTDRARARARAEPPSAGRVDQAEG